jgi:outer membrane protein OmpA-like peptidoglycan-associated protein
MLTLLALLSPASAAETDAPSGYSTDIELARPTFSPGVLPGIDAPGFGSVGTLRVGMLAAYERDPLLLYRETEEVGAVVRDRLMAHVGVSADLTKRLSFRLVLPVGTQGNSQVSRLAADAGGFGDLGAGLRVHVVKAGPVNLGARADLLLPVGSPDRYMGEEGLRGIGGVLAEGDLGPMRLLADVSVTGRQKLDTGEDFTLGSELNLAGAAMLDIWPERLALGVGAIHRAGLADLWEGGAENPVELLAGLQLSPSRDWQVDVGFGRGVAAGYGTTALRAYAGLTWVRTPQERLPPPPEVAVVKVVEAPPEPDIPEDFFEPPPPPPKPDWKPQELVRVEEAQIVIRDPIQFELGTDRILPMSLPTLKAIAEQLQKHPEIAHVVIEGHASDEGSFKYNYELSLTRSLSVYRALVEVGVHPSRMSCRGMGEVRPVLIGTDEAALAANRRVIFQIVRRLRSDEPTPELEGGVKLPWTGEDAKILPLPERQVAPPPPPPEPEPERPARGADRTDPGLFDDTDDEESP